MTSREATTKPSPPAGNLNSRAVALKLACKECQRKKTRCDRTYPCTPCTRAAIPCVPSTRKPRAKTGAKAVDAELRSRIAKLERLVESFHDGDSKDAAKADLDEVTDDEEDEAAPQAPDSDGTSPPPITSPNTSKYIAGSFWSSLTAEVQALREVFEEDGNESDGEGGSSDPTPSSHSHSIDLGNPTHGGYELIFCPPGQLYVMPGALTEPEGLCAVALWDDYILHVEPAYKLLHIPTLRPFMERGEPLYGRDADALSNKALKAAIYFTSAVSMPESECQRYFGKPRDIVTADFRKYADISLHAADPLNTTELATLQAMILYVGALRIIDNSRRAWSLLGLLVRIARAMNLHRESPDEKIYLRELRRRLWHNLVFLDCYASLDRGSEPAIHPDSFSRPLPLHVNDADFGPETTSLVAREGELTDMSLPLMTQDGSVIILRLSLPEDAINNETWQHRLEMAYSYQRKIQSQFLRFCDPSIPFHSLIIGIGYAASHSMILRAVRPMQYNLSSVPPRVDSPWILQLAVNILRHCDSMWTEKNSGGWRRMPWVPWHAIVVALAGLCSIRGTDLANEAWVLVDRSMVYYAASVADSRTGLLWKPIERLRRKAVAFRDQLPPDQQSPPPVAVQPKPNRPMANPQPIGPINPIDPIVMDHMVQQFDPNIAMPDMSFNFPSEMAASLPPADASWFDWENIMRDMGDVNFDGMQVL